MTTRDADDGDTPINGESLGDTSSYAETDAAMRAFLVKCGFLAAEIDNMLHDEVPPGAIAFAAIARVAERVTAMEAYLRAKIAKDGASRIVKPWKN